MSRSRVGDGVARFSIPALATLGAALILSGGSFPDALMGVFGANTRIGMIWDSGHYLSLARNLAAGDGFVIWNGAPSADAPVFPLLMAAGELIGIDAVAAARYVNAAAFGLTVFAVAAWLKRRVRAPLLAVWAGCVCALMPALIYAAASVWTEIIFILFTVVCLALLDRFLSGGKAPALLLAAAAASAACLTRYIGVTLILAGALILLLRNDTGMRTRIRDTALWSAASLAPMGAWMVRNLQVIGSPFVVYADGFSGLLSLHRATGEFALWLFRPTGFDLLNGAFGYVTGIDLAGLTVTAIAARSLLLAATALGAGYALARYRPEFLRANRIPLTIAIVFAAAYSLFLVGYLPLRDVTLPVRYLLPLFPPLLVAATMVLDGFFARGSFTNAAAAKIGPVAAVPAVVATVMSLGLAGDTYHIAKAALNDPRGRIEESAILRYLSANRLAGDDVWTNHPPALHFATGQRRIGTISQSLAEVTDRLANRDPAESIYLVLFGVEWYHAWFGDSDYEFDDLAALPGVELVADLDDGVIFHRPSSASSADESVVRAYFDIHVYEDALVYFKEPCTEADVQAHFFLRVIPGRAGLSAAARAEGAAFNSLDFAFAERGVIQDGRCLAVVPLDYEIMQFHTGQFRPGHPLSLANPPFWEVKTTTPAPE